MKLKLFLFSIVFLAGCAQTLPDGSKVQIYGPIDKIYPVEEAKNLTLYKNLLGVGKRAEELNAPGSFVETYSDTAYTLHKFHRTIYIPPELRPQIEMGKIVKSSRYFKDDPVFNVVTEVLPWTHKASYDCVQRSPLEGIATCIYSVENTGR